MKYYQAVLPAIIGISIVTLQPLSAKALSSVEVGKIAEGITVLIDYKDNPENGSGVILNKVGNTYTVLTAAHVVAKSNLKYEIVAPDNQRYPLNYSSVKKLPNQVDLAVVTFTSNKNYQVAKIGNSDTSERGTLAYISGFPGTNKAINQFILNFTEGKVTANSNQPLNDGYGLIYSNITVGGMSGGAVLNEKGELIGIHGRSDSDRYDEESDSLQKSGFNLGIPINTFVRLSSQVGVNTQVTAPPVVATALKAEDFFAQAVNKEAEKDYKGAISDLTQAINRNPQYAEAFYGRGTMHANLKDYQRAISDFNQAIKINPNLARAYNNRGVTRRKLKDYQGAINDFNQAIKINPKYGEAYGNRGNARGDLKDYQGAIYDYDQAITINLLLEQSLYSRAIPRGNLKDYQEVINDLNQARTQDQGKFNQIHSNYAILYYHRGNALAKLKDYQGAINDLQKAGELYQQQGKQQEYQQTLELIELIKKEIR